MKMKKIFLEYDLPQGSDEWLAVRKNHGTASEAAAACEISPWKPKNRYELYQLKQGNMKIDMNFAMAHGHKYEEEARVAVQDRLNKIFEPLCITNEVEGMPLMASLDGMEQITGASILEIKCPLKGCESPLWNTMMRGEALPMQYQLQMTQQMLLADVKECHFWVYCAHTSQGRYRLFKQSPDLTRQLLDAWKLYFKEVPKPAKTDVVALNTSDWNRLANEWLAIKSKHDSVSNELKVARDALLEIAGSQSFKGNGVVVKFNDKGLANVRRG
jgi:putative phage-type endonuclease